MQREGIYIGLPMIESEVSLLRFDFTGLNEREEKWLRGFMQLYRLIVMKIY